MVVEALSRTVPTEAARWLLETNNRRDELINESQRSLISDQVSLRACEETLLQVGGALSELCTLIREKDGLGHVMAPKLLVTKFPAVVPIRDSKVETLLGLEKVVSGGLRFEAFLLQMVSRLLSASINSRFPLKLET